MPHTLGSADADLLLIEGLEIEPLPDSLLAADGAGTSDQWGCCSMEQCSNPPSPDGYCSCEACSRPAPDDPCTWWSLFGDA